jgi:transcriptional regulator with XRE-family HTH domain
MSVAPAYRFGLLKKGMPRQRKKRKARINPTGGAVLRAARVARGLSQRAMAAELDVSQPTINDWETGRKIPKSSRLSDVADKYDVAVSDIVPARSEAA